MNTTSALDFSKLADIEITTEMIPKEVYLVVLFIITLLSVVSLFIISYHLNRYTLSGASVLKARLIYGVVSAILFLIMLVSYLSL